MIASADLKCRSHALTMMRRPAFMTMVAVLLATAICVPTHPASAGSTTCRVDVRDGHTLAFSGMLSRKVFPGPPNYEDVRSGDRPEPTYILALDESTCALNAMYGTTDPFTRVHLVGDAHVFSTLRRLVGQHVAVIGSDGDVGITGHYHAPFFVKVADVRSSKRRR